MNINEIAQHCPKYKEESYVGSHCEVGECNNPVKRVFIFSDIPSLSLCRSHGYEYSSKAKKESNGKS